MTRRYTTTVCNIMARKDADRKGGGPRYELDVQTLAIYHGIYPRRGGIDRATKS